MSSCFPLRVLLGTAFSCIALSVCAQTTFLNTGSVWKYSTGADLGTAWREVAYNDSAWSSGPSQLGFGDGDEATIVPSGPSGNRNPTVYFRHTVNIADPAAFTFLNMQVKRDDGVVVYVNGVEVFRENIAGTPAYNSWATEVITNENSFITALLSPGSFVPGANVIAAEVHQLDAGSSDLSFDLKLTGGGTLPSVTVSRGPYLQLGTPTSMFLRWKTNVATDTKVRYGLSAGNLDLSVTDGQATLNHVIQLTGLTPATKYYYSIGSAGAIVQGDTNNYFLTAPPVGTEQVTRIWATGDCGTGQSVQTNVLNAYQSFIGNNYTHVWLLLGDNAYQNGTDGEYQSRFFQPYMNGKVMRQTALFPSPGNHDYANDEDLLESRDLPYYEAFILPTAGEAGGVPSGTEMYYSYNYANIHFISLDSYGTENGLKLYDTTGAQINWLKQDLAANTQKWTILYWHHPPYTMGSHNSNNEDDLVDIREKVISILDRYKVDLILCGHSHNYERTKIMKGHYGAEHTYSPALHNSSTSSGLYDGSANSCPYVKSSASAENEGIVYVVAGSAGKIGGTQFLTYPHNAMHYSNSDKGGSIYIEVNGNRLDAKWIAEDHAILDKFTIVKDVNNHTEVMLRAGDTATLTASWQGVYQWDSVTSAARAVPVSPADTASYIVTDAGFNCLHDTFKVNVLHPVHISGTIFTEDGDLISGVQVKLTGFKEDSLVTGPNGMFDFEVPAAANYFITASKAPAIPTNSGLTTLDIAFMRRHILGNAQLSSYYKMIAADVNSSGLVTTADISAVRKMVLDNTVTFPNNKTWKFIAGFSNPADPFAYFEKKTYTNVLTDQQAQHFIGIKLGDVNGSWNPANP